MVSFSVSLFSYSGHCHSVLTYCYDLTAHQGPGDPHVYPAPLSSRAKNSTASSCLLYWNIPQAPQTQHVPSALTIHGHPSSCHHCHPLLLCLRPIHSSSSIGEPTIYPPSQPVILRAPSVTSSPQASQACCSVNSASSSPPHTTVLVWVLFLSHLH